MGKMLVNAGRMAVNGGRMVTTDASDCCCGGVCDTSWVDATTCYIIGPCNDPSTCTNGCTARPGSVFVLRNYDVSWPSGPFLRRVQVSNVVLKLKQKDFPGTGRKYRWQGEATALVTRKSGTFGLTFEVPVCAVLTAQTDGNGRYTWQVRLESSDFSNGPVTGGRFRANYTVFDTTGKTDNCGDCFGGLTDPITYTEGHLGAYCDQQDATTVNNWTGGWSGDLFGTLATDNDCVGCTSVYAEFKPCNRTDTRVFWSRVSSCPVGPGLCTISTEPGVCISSTGNTFPIDSIIPSGVTVIDPVCGTSTNGFPNVSCCACRYPVCCDSRGGRSSLWDDRCTPGDQGTVYVEDIPCPCHHGATASSIISGSGTIFGRPFTVSGSFTGTKTNCGWTYSGSVTSTGLNADGSTFTFNLNQPTGIQAGVPLWNIFPLGSPFDGPSTQSNGCATHVVTGGFVSGEVSGSQTMTTSYTYDYGDCGGMSCDCGSGGGFSGTADAIDKLDSFFGGIA